MSDPGDKSLRVSAPGRICLFGEHQDYLGLPVIPCAISMRISVEGTKRSDPRVAIDLPDIGRQMRFSLEEKLTYPVARDYFRSAVNVLRRHGLSFSHGCDCVVRGDIPINSGTSSSSALTVAWVSFLAQISDQEKTLTPLECARYAHEAEVVEFGEPGGMMDHISTALGGITAIEFNPGLKVETLDAGMEEFVLGDSGEPKDTTAILARVKNRVLEASKRLAAGHPGFSLLTSPLECIDEFGRDLDGDQQQLLHGTLRNREITKAAKRLLCDHPLNHHAIGALLNEHQGILRDVLGISTAKIDAMIDASLDAGASGGKINGSGGGGAMFVYAPGRAHEVADAIRRAGGKPYVVSVDRGLWNERPEGPC